MAQAAKNEKAGGHKPVGTDVSTARRVSRLRRHNRLRKRVAGTPERPRLVVKRSSRHIHVQLVDDTVGRTLASASTIGSINVAARSQLWAASAASSASASLPCCSYPTLARV